jgi:hypothetical protein
MALKTIKASGGDYTTLSAWEASLPATLTEVETAECYNFALTDDVAISGSTTSATNYIRIYTPPAERHDGRSRAVSGTGFRLTANTGATPIRYGSVNHVRLEGLEIVGSATSATVVDYQLGGSFTSGGNDHQINHCIIHDTIVGTGYTITAGAANLSLTFIDNIVYGYQRSWDTRNAASVVASNNTFWRHAAQLGLVSSTELVCKNAYSGASTAGADDYWSGGTPTGNNNASSDTSATARFTSSINSVAGSAVFTSVTAGAEDFTLKTGTNALVEAGATLASVTDDIKGTARPQGSLYDIGAFERVVAGGVQFLKTVSGTLTLSAVLPRSIGKSIVAGISFAGASLRTSKKYIQGSISFSGQIIKSTYKQLSSTLVVTGSIVKATYKKLSSNLVVTGSIVKATYKQLSSNLVVTGSIVKATYKQLSSNLVVTGSTVKATYKQLSSNLVVTGSIVKSTYKKLSSSLVVTGSIVKATYKQLSSSLVVTGSIVKATSKNIIASISVSGILGGIKQSGAVVYTQAVGGVIGFVGAVRKYSNKLITGTYGMAGGISKSSARSISGLVSSIGVVIKQSTKVVSGNTAFSGTLSSLRARIISIGGVIGFSGATNKRVSKYVSGVISVSSQILKTTSRSIAAGLVFVGNTTVSRIKYIVVAGSLVMAGAITKVTAKISLGVLSISGVTTKLVAKTISGVLSLSGLLNIAANLSSFVARLLGTRKVDSENRVLKAEAQTRVSTIEPSNRTNIIRGD